MTVDSLQRQDNTSRITNIKPILNFYFDHLHSIFAKLLNFINVDLELMVPPCTSLFELILASVVTTQPFHKIYTFMDVRKRPKFVALAMTKSYDSAKFSVSMVFYKSLTDHSCII